MAVSMVYMLLICGIFWLPAYVLMGISLYSLAERRGIDRPMQAWMPGMRLYLMGCIADQYQAMVVGKNRNKRTALLLLLMGELICFCVFYFLVPAATQTGNMRPIMLVVVFAWCIVAAMIVISYMALGDIYRSCDPKHTATYLLLSIVFPVTVPFFLFSCRKKDLGFPL